MTATPTRRIVTNIYLTLPSVLLIAIIIGCSTGVLISRWINLRSEKLGEDFLVGKSIDNSMLFASEILDRSGVRIGEISRERRYLTALGNLPPHVINAFLAAEDGDFYQHGPISLTGTLRATFLNLWRGEYAQGASTISQQLARILFLSPKKTLSRKVDELALAVALEKKFSKDRILELYLNKVFLGNHAYGIEAGAWTYFSKSATALNLAEAALLAGVIAAPSKYAPHRDFLKAKIRQEYVIGQLCRRGQLSEQEAHEWLGHSLKITQKSLEDHEDSHYFVDYIRSTMERDLSLQNIDSSGLRVNTTIDRKVQESLRDASSQYLAKTFSLDRVRETGDTLEVAIVLMDMSSGNILGLKGGRHFFTKQFNHATMLRRRLGSLFMPFYYALAFDSGFNLLSSIYSEAKVVNDLQPKDGEDNLYSALSGGKAAESARLLSWLGIGTVLDSFSGLGFQFGKSDLSVALGSALSSPINALAAMTMFVNGGEAKRPKSIVNILKPNGEELYVHNSGETKAVISAEAAFIVRQVLRETGADPRNTSYLGAKFANEFAAVSGSEPSLQDGWFAGFNDQVGLILWVGSEQGKFRLADNEKDLRKKLAHFWVQVMEEIPIDALKSDQKLDHPSVPEGVSFARLGNGKQFLPFKTGTEPL